MAQNGERSVRELLNDLSFNLRTLLRQELALARAEVTQSVVHTRRGVILIGAGAAFGFVSVLVLAAAACFGLYVLGLSPVAATSVVGVTLAIIGYMFIHVGRKNLTPDRVAPRATVEAFKDSAQIIRGHLP
jgi:hypothetical protein